MMINKFFASIKEYNMINKGDTVAVCLSGGADSMALFHLLYVNREKLGINLIVLHVNHGLRKESEEEELFIKDYCNSLGVECIIYKAFMNQKQKPQGCSVEMWARQLRYEFFQQNAEKYSAKLATAHTLSDKCETVIFNISRGASLKGACGIPAVRGNIIRPLIDCTRSEIEKYCAENNIPFVTDKTNFTLDYSRNKIRLKVIPVLKQINEKSENSIGEFSKEMEQIYTFLTQLSDILYENCKCENGFCINTILKENDVVIKFFLRNLLSEYNCLSKDNINDILEGLKQKSFSKQLSQNVICCIENGFLVFLSPKPKQTVDIEKIPVIINQKISFLSKNITVKKISAEYLKKCEKRYLKNCIDCDKIEHRLFLRTRMTGDTFTLSKRNVTKTIKKLFIEDKISKEDRDTMVILSDENNNVIWLEDYGVNKRFSVGENSRNIYLVEKE